MKEIAIDAKSIIGFISILFTIIGAVWFLAGLVNNLNSKIMLVDNKVNNVLTQIQAFNEVQNTKLNARVDELELQVDNCSCLKKKGTANQS